MRLFHWLLMALSFCFIETAYAQLNSDWTGSFEGQIFGANATMIALLSGDQWKGTIAVSGYPVKFEGTMIDNQARGTLTDEQAKTSSAFTAKYAGNQITINMHDINPITGLEENMDFIFFKVKDQQVVGSILSSSVNVVDSPPPSTIDRSLLGLWRFTDTYVSGDYSFATDYFIQFNANGILLLTDGRTAGGGPASSLDTGDGDTHQGEWKSEKNTVYTKDAKNRWQSYARYVVDGNTMMLTYANGKKQVWEKM